MIRFGADEIFKSGDSTITDEDIDLIISRGAQRTEELNEKFQSSANTLLDFSLGNTNPQQQASLYQFQVRARPSSLEPAHPPRAYHEGGCAILCVRACVFVCHTVSIHQGVDYSAEARGGRKKQSWMKPPSRTRKVAKDYSVDGYYRGVMRPDKGANNKKGPAAPRALKQPVLHDFQLFPARLHELLHKEAAAYAVPAPS